MRAESFAETQLRLHLETHCAREFMKLIKGALGRYPVTLIMFDYGDNGAVAFKTNLVQKALINTFELLLRSWKERRPRVAFVDRNEPSPLPSLEDLQAIGASIERSEAVGYALLVGAGDVSSYIASGDRAGVIEVLETVLLPAWREST